MTTLNEDQLAVLSFEKLMFPGMFRKINLQFFLLKNNSLSR